MRLICDDDSPGGPDFKETLVPTDVGGEYPGRAQPIHDGSYVIVPSTQALASLRSFTLQTMVWPTTPGRGRQALLGTWCEQTGTGFGLYIDEAGALAVCIGAGSGTCECLSTGTPLVGRQWYAAAASFDADSGELRVFQRPLNVGPGVGDAVSARKTVSIELVHRESVPLLMAAQAEAPGAALVGAHFNGKLESPTVLADLTEDIVGCWDFSHELSGVRVIDLSVGALHGATVNMPTRGVRGHNWTGSEHCWRHAPEQYGAIHFHDDDLYDAGWQTDFALTTPESMRSGIYCARLIGAKDEECIPFFVRPPAGKKTSDVVLLVSTATYMAYANMQFAMNSIFAEPKEGAITELGPDDVFLQENPGYGLSLYDKHSDETGVCYTSRLRPIFNMRPKSSLWSLNADTHVTDWLETIGQGYDVVTDEDLHHEGLSALDSYRVVVTGAHPEYWSTAMWEAMVAYQGCGGRLMYLGGNGFYWRIAYHDTLPGIVELGRAEGGMRYQSTEPGEYYQSFNGEFGGSSARESGVLRNTGRRRGVFHRLDFVVCVARPSGIRQQCRSDNRKCTAAIPGTRSVVESVGAERLGASRSFFDSTCVDRSLLNQQSPRRRGC